MVVMVVAVMMSKTLSRYMPHRMCLNPALRMTYSYKSDTSLIAKISNPIYLSFISLSARDLVAVFVHGTGRNNSSERCSMRSSVGSQLPSPMHDNGTPAAQTRWRGSSCLKLALAHFGVFVGQWGAVCWRGGEGKGGVELHHAHASRQQGLV
jgi:hypothetical protein